MPQPDRTAQHPGADTRGDRTRRAIVAAARRRFSRGGFEETTLADVARDAGVSGPTVAFHFGSKDGLLTAVVHDYYDELLAQIDDVIDAPSSPAGRLAAFARFWLGAHEDSYALFGTFATQGGWRPPASASGVALRDCNRRVTRVLERLIDDLKADGTLRADVSTRLLRDAFFGTAEHVMRGQIVAGRPFDPARTADELLALLLGGAAAAQAPAPAPASARLAAIEHKLDLLLARPGG